MNQEIKITAHLEAHHPETCKFVIEQAVYPEGSAYFPNREKARGSPLGEQLFAIEGVTAVRIAGNEVSVTRPGVENWRPIAGRVAEVIRAHIRSGAPAVSKEFAAQKIPDSVLMARVQAIFDTQINPAVAEHGGHVELLDVRDNKVYIQMGGGCQGCGMADVTLRQGIEATIRREVPEVDEILDTTDHATGANPYYTPAKK
jgi:Fe-S cluster biogenesis protein NfuA